MVIYALVPTGGISKTKAAAIAQFLDFVATAASDRRRPGRAARGYLPLPETLREQTLKAATEVLDQVGNPKPKPKASASASATEMPSASLSDRPSPSASLRRPRDRALGHRVVQQPGHHRHVVGGARPAHRRRRAPHQRPAALVFGQPGARRRIVGRRPRIAAGRRAGTAT